MARDIAISIINYKTPDMTIACAQSVLDTLDDIDAEILIVDNRSDDGSIEQLEAWHASLPSNSPVQLVWSKTNAGFSGGHNQGMAVIEADYYLILNSDSLLRSGFLTRILAEARAYPDAGFIAPRLESEDGHAQNSCFRFPNPVSEFIRGADTGLITKILSKYDTPMGIDPDAAEVDWVSFACVLVNARMVSEIGPMDEGYFLYFEDTEYCLRAQRAGWRARQCPEAIAAHFEGGSGPVRDIMGKRGRLPTYYYSSRTRFLYQAHGWIGLWSANLLWFVGRGIAGLRQLAGRKRNNFRQAEIVDIWTNTRRPLGPRHAPGE